MGTRLPKGSEDSEPPAPLALPHPGCLPCLPWANSVRTFWQTLSHVGRYKTPPWRDNGLMKQEWLSFEKSREGDYYPILSWQFLTFFHDPRWCPLPDPCSSPPRSWSKW